MRCLVKFTVLFRTQYVCNYSVASLMNTLVIGSYKAKAFQSRIIHVHVCSYNHATHQGNVSSCDFHSPLRCVVFLKKLLFSFLSPPHLTSPSSIPLLCTSPPSHPSLSSAPPLLLTHPSPLHLTSPSPHPSPLFTLLSPSPHPSSTTSPLPPPT